MLHFEIFIIGVGTYITYAYVVGLIIIRFSLLAFRRKPLDLIELFIQKFNEIEIFNLSLMWRLLTKV